MGIWTGPSSRKVQWWHANVDDGLTRYLGRWLVHKNAAVHDGSRRELQSTECWGNACEEVSLLQPRGLWLQWKKRNYRLGPFFFLSELIRNRWKSGVRVSFRLTERDVFLSQCLTVTYVPRGANFGYDQPMSQSCLADVVHSNDIIILKILLLKIV